MILKLLALVMVFSLLPAMRLTAAAAEDDSIAYVNAAGENMDAHNCIHVNEDDTNWTDQNATNGWYALTTSWYFWNTIYVNGTVNLILCDSPTGTYTLTAEKGIVLTEGSHLIIWAQSNGTGKIVAYGGEEYHPGIGNYASNGNSGNLTINGGNISASGGVAPRVSAAAEATAASSS